jgi:hypothetical protein
VKQLCGIVQLICEAVVWTRLESLRVSSGEADDPSWQRTPRKKEEMMINEFREILFLSVQPCLRIKVSSQRNIDVSTP